MSAERREASRAVVLERQGPWVVLLTGEGEFRRLRLPPGADWAVGDEVRLEAPAPAARRWRPAWAAAAVAAVLLVALAVLAPWARPAAWAYVSLDWQGGLEFTTDRQGRVIEARGFSPAAEQILRQVPWQGRPVGQVLAAAGDAEMRASRSGGPAAGQAPPPVLVGVAPAGPGRSLQAVEVQVRSAAKRLEGLFTQAEGEIPVVLVEAPNPGAAASDRAESVGLSRARAALEAHLPAVAAGEDWSALARQLQALGVNLPELVGGQVLGAAGAGPGGPKPAGPRPAKPGKGQRTPEEEGPGAAGPAGPAADAQAGGLAGGAGGAGAVAGGGLAGGSGTGAAGAAAGEPARPSEAVRGTRGAGPAAKPPESPSGGMGDRVATPGRGDARQFAEGLTFLAGQGIAVVRHGDRLRTFRVPPPPAAGCELRLQGAWQVVWRCPEGTGGRGDGAGGAPGEGRAGAAGRLPGLEELGQRVQRLLGGDGGD